MFILKMVLSTHAIFNPLDMAKIITRKCQKRHKIHIQRNSNRLAIKQFYVTHNAKEVNSAVAGTKKSIPKPLKVEINSYSICSMRPVSRQFTACRVPPPQKGYT